MVTLPPAGSVSGAGAGTSEDSGCRKERELHPALSTSDGKDTVAGRGETEVLQSKSLSSAPPMPRCCTVAPEVSLEGTAGSSYCSWASCSGEPPNPSARREPVWCNPWPGTMQGLLRQMELKSYWVDLGVR